MNPARSRWTRRFSRQVRWSAPAALLVLLLVGCTPALTAAPPAEAPPPAVQRPTVLGLVPEQLSPPVDLRAAVTATPPASVDLTQWALPAGDQGSVNSCVSWALNYAALGWYQRRNLVAGGPLAPMYTYAQLVKGVNRGTTFTDTLAIATSQGVDNQADYVQGNYDFTTQPTAAQRANAAKWKLSGFTTLANNQTAIQASLAANRPVLIGMAVYQNFMSVSAANRGFYAAASGPLVGYHAVTALGYDSAGLRIQNSWSARWGDKGFATLAWDFVNRGGVISAIEVGPFAPGAPTIAAPTVTGLSVGAGPTNGGSTLTISGTDLTGATAVRFGNTNAAIGTVAASGNSMTVTVPPGAAGTVNVTVTTPAGNSPSAPAAAYRYVAAPAVGSMSPTVGSTAGGTTVTVNGANLAGATVGLGTARLTPTVSATGNSLTFRTPAGTGTATVTVSTAGGTVTAGTFRWAGAPTVSGVSPLAGPAAGGTALTITGAFLNVGSPVVMIGNRQASVRTVTADGNTITVTVPAGVRGATTLSVRTDVGSSAPRTWTYL